MKRLLIIATTALLALPSFGEEKTEEKAADKQAQPQAAQTAQPAPDSPLVAAAKKANRGAKKSVVITNDDLRNSKGHITTTTQSRSLNVADPLPTPEMVHAEKQAKIRTIAAEKAAKDQAVKKAEEEKMQRAAAAAEEGEDPYGDADPAAKPPEQPKKP